MVMKFRTEKRQSIVFCILDITDNCKSGYAKEICINLTDFLIHRIDLHDYDIFISKDEDALLTEATKDYTYAVMISAGTSLGLSDRLFDAVKDQCKEDFFIAGHILDRSGNPYFKNSCFELHQQFYIINLDQYRELGCPIVGKEESVEYQQLAPLRSKECLYDDPEIPAWMKKGTELKVGIIKAVHRIVPMLLAPFFPILAIFGYVLGTSRAFNKVIVPILADPGHDYPDFLKKVIDATMRVAEGDLTTEKDRFTRAFVVSDRLIEAIKPEVLQRFSLELSEKMANTDSNLEVPQHYIENELKDYLNRNFEVNPEIPLKD